MFKQSIAEYSTTYPNSTEPSDPREFRPTVVERKLYLQE
jgi:hypothetical protein